MKYRFYISYCGRGSFDLKHANYDNLTLPEIGRKINEFNSNYIVVSAQFFENTLQELRQKVTTNATIKN